MRLTKFNVLFVICTLAISIAIPAYAADGAATYKASGPPAMALRVRAKSVRP
jgi:hypothetical protein